MSRDQSSEDLKQSLEERILEQHRRSLINNSGNSLGQPRQNRSSLQHAEIDGGHHHHQGILGGPPTNMQPMLNLSNESYLGAFAPFRNVRHVPLLNHQRLQAHTLPNSHLNNTGNMLIDARSHQSLSQYATRQVPQVYYDPLLIPVAYYNPLTLSMPVGGASYNPLTASTRRIEQHVRHVPHPLISTQQTVPNRTIESEICSRCLIFRMKATWEHMIRSEMTLTLLHSIINDYKHKRFQIYISC
eukprot:CAMPEP_0204641792 /NCGR_PEP_ID=MMETSP0717-20131115/51330_1 /ASSEMBLY_ACC=CAM_ASM_000666 /TAXON_ID=230516 /ORGANISM="Chaetoceros curvisetus" /LENGTH=243 /DNA_ID=CAMNT_0051662503 /DNA_START=1 /DNA_END=732 /DNA_ORIENTATION=+